MVDSLEDKERKLYKVLPLGFQRGGAKDSLMAGNAGNGNYTVNGKEEDIYAEESVKLIPGFTAAPSVRGVVRILENPCY